MAAPMRIVVVGASAGGIEALTALLATLRAEMNAAFFVVQHLSPNYVSHLPQVLSRRCALSVAFATDGKPIECNSVFVAPPDHHLLISKDAMFVTRGPKENRFRPSIDALFRSAAYCHGPDVIGIVLSGALDDGTSGLWAIKRLNGIAIVQEPSEAAFDSMPSSALDQVEIDYCLPVREVGGVLTRLANEARLKEAEHADADRRRIEMEVAIASEGDAFRKGVMEAAQLTPFTCPECHGVLVQINEGKVTRYRCHTGHGYSRSALLSDIMEKVDESYWGAMKSLEEAAMLLNRLGQEYADRGQAEAAAVFSRREHYAVEQSRQLRDALLNRDHFSVESLLDKARQT